MHFGWLAVAAILFAYIWIIAAAFMCNSRPIPPEVRWGGRAGLVAVAACIVHVFI